MTDLDKLEAATKLRRILNAHPRTRVYDLPEMAGLAYGHPTQAIAHLCVELMEHLAAQRQAPEDRAAVLDKIDNELFEALAELHDDGPKAAKYCEQHITKAREALRDLAPWVKGVG